MFTLATDLISVSTSLTCVVLSAVASLIVNIYGDGIRARFRSPKLRVTVVDPCGEWTLLGSGKRVPAIYFHVLVENEKPSRVAKNVELLITECFISDCQRDIYKLPLASPLPIKARRSDTGVNGSWLDIGAAPVGYDLIKCEQAFLTILLNCNYPNNFECWIRGEGSLRFTLQALGTNAASNKLFVDVAWDGIFPADQALRENHLRLKAVTDL